MRSHRSEKELLKRTAKLEKELAARKRELRIEAALEKVRVVATRMNKPDQLPDICKILFKQLFSLGFVEMRNAMINIHSDADKSFINYDYSDEMGKTTNHLVYDIHPLIEKQIKKIRSAGDAFSETYFTGRDLVEWRKFRKKIGEKDDPRIRKSKGLYYYFYSIGVGSIGISTFGAISKEKKDLLKRFRNVFNLSYQRYVDISKAEAQAREAQIEAALERVRTKTMAMQRSEELQETTLVLFQQFKSLKATTSQVSICVFDEDTKMGEMFVTLKGEKIDRSFQMDLNKEVFVMKKAKKAFLDRQKKFSFTIKGKELQSYNHWRNTLIGKKGWDESNAVRRQSWFVNGVFFSRGLMGVSSDTPATLETLNLLDRFASVFDLTFTRFLDLQKAEAQAREAQIEAALEKVRSRSMAMQRSSELAEVATMLFQQVKALGVPQWTCGFCIFEIDDKEFTWYPGGPDGEILPPCKIPLTEHPVFISFNESRKRGDELYVYEKTGEAQADHYRYMLTLPIVGEYLQSRLDVGEEFPAFQIDHLANFSHGNLIFITYKPFPEMHDIFKRFAKVFDQTYTRFLDLQKAEAQAREAQVEAALEKVRARTMGMQRSDELSDTAYVLFQQFVALGENPIQITIGVMKEEERSMEFRVTDWAGGGSRVSTGFDVSIDEPTLIRKMYEAWKRNDKSIVIDLSGPDLEGWLQYRNKVSGVQVKSTDTRGRRVVSVAFFSKGMIAFSTPVPRPQESVFLLERFAAVFDLTYTRFLDLKNAEAQARESQIQLALERVRARTMAMQKSDELADAARLLYEEFRTLDIKTLTCGYCFIKEEQQKQTAWVTLPDGTLIPDFIDFPLAGDPVLSKRYNDWKEKKPLHVLEIKDEVNKAHHEYLKSQVDNEVAHKIFSQLPDRITFYCGNFSAGYLFIIATESLSPEEEEIIVRFAKVFELTYTRFSDLKQAETRAREAQIETALERVRSRSMAMHRSGDLQEVIKVVAEQFMGLGLRFDTTYFAKVQPDRSWDVWISTPQQAYPSQIFIPYFKHRVFTDVEEMNKSRKDFLTLQYTLEEKNSFFRHFFENTVARSIPEARKEYVYGAKGDVRSVFRLRNIFFAVACYDGVPYSDEENAVFRRFANVFEQAYTRFLDLQKAEAQAREAQIEAALERVRSHSMAMHQSSDLHDVIKVVTEQLSGLGIKFNAANFAKIHSEGSWDLWISTPEQAYPSLVHVPYMNHRIFNNLKGVIGKGLDFFADVYDKQEKNIFFKHFFENTVARQTPDARKEYVMNCAGFARSVFLTKNIWFAFSNYDGVAFSDEENAIFKRFATAFEQSYTRFLDLQRAEANAREAQIEASLERVRSKTMAMHNSNDVGETVATMFSEFVHLDIHTNRCGILIFNDERTAEVWTARSTTEGPAKLIIGRLDLEIHPMLSAVGRAWKAKEVFYEYQLAGEDLSRYYTAINNAKFYPTQFDLSALPQHEFHSDFFFADGAVFSFTNESVAEEHAKIMRRFAAVFGQTYRRYLDLQKAEAQAREAQIEAGLERVRAKTMAMHTSDDVSAATATMFTELEKLGIENFRGGITNILRNRTQDVWSVNNLDPGKVVKAVGAFNIDAHPFWQLMFKEWEAKKDFMHYFLAAQEKEDYIKILNSTQGYLTRAIENFPDVHFQVYFFNEGGVWTNSLRAHSEEEQQIMKRFTSVFSLTFRRYQDLKKAEAQAREATIEAALEKVRGKAMAMHNSNDLSATASMVFTELRRLGINPIRCGVGLLNKESRKAQLYSATSSADGDGLSLVGWVILSEHPVLEKIYDTWLNNEEYYPELQGEQMRAYYQLLLKGLPVVAPEIEADKKQYGHFLPFSIGCLYAWSDTAYTDTEIKILRRFATIIDLTFRRYMELQHSEASAREAVKQAALDRIRADIASMRTVGDLDRITPLIWNELTILGLPFIRCGIFLMDESQRLIHTFLSTPDGKAIGAFHLPYNTPSFDEVVDHWRHKKIFINHWIEPDYIAMGDTLVKQGAIADREQYVSTLPVGGFYLHFMPFLQGMLYVGNIEKLGEEEISLIESVADAFSTAYARYEDFNKLEAAKQQVEKTLTDLKQAQTQLVQSEKMASLGELTAGIAHEIQNPLNFVNNFSDVSNELLDEMKDELAKGNINDAIAIAHDVKLNLEKINHHGKRADGIVKGMLQHSRTSSGQKELTDINALADEYLRLAYHGLRAKDKSFNAKFETNFDDKVGKIDIIQQDIGRVILNLINNAFYAVSEKKKNVPGDYEPTVLLTTLRDNGKIEIRVKDNGDGISQKNLDKVFQPFFTTKPTGQGTGLGLSLAYDVVKAHGGDIKVETKEGEGSEFIISIPFN